VDGPRPTAASVIARVQGQGTPATVASDWMRVQAEPTQAIHLVIPGHPAAARARTEAGEADGIIDTGETVAAEPLESIGDLTGPAGPAEVGRPGKAEQPGMLAQAQGRVDGTFTPSHTTARPAGLGLGRPAPAAWRKAAETVAARAAGLATSEDEAPAAAKPRAARAAKKADAEVETVGRSTRTAKAKADAETVTKRRSSAKADVDPGETRSTRAAAAKPAKPAATPAKPAATPAKPAATPAKPAATPAKPAATPATTTAKPTTTTVKPAAAAAKPTAAAPAKPASRPAAGSSAAGGSAAGSGTTRASYRDEAAELLAASTQRRRRRTPAEAEAAAEKPRRRGAGPTQG
jgi:hypothetical protein